MIYKELTNGDVLKKETMITCRICGNTLTLPKGHKVDQRGEPLCKCIQEKMVGMKTGNVEDLPRIIHAIMGKDHKCGPEKEMEIIKNLIHALQTCITTMGIVQDGMQHRINEQEKKIAKLEKP